MTSIPSLPYYDPEPTDEERDLVDALILQQIVPQKSLHPSIADRDEWKSSSALINAELERIASGKKLDAIDLSRYESVDVPNESDSQALHDAVTRGIVASNAMADRIDNLSLLKSFGSNAWTMHVYHLEQELRSVEADLQDVRGYIDQVNRERKVAQIGAGQRLTELTDRWKHLVSSNLELNIACAMLEREIDSMG